MLNVTHAMERMEISTTSVTSAIQTVREICDASTDKCKAAAKLIQSLLSIETKFDNEDVARVTAQAVVEAIIKAGGEIDNEAELYAAAVDRADKHINKPENRWMYFYHKDDAPNSNEQRAIEGTEVKVEIKADGKIKRGGKQVIAEALFKKHVTDSTEPCDNACFVKILMKEAGMSLAGARTYAHNCRKAAGLVK